MACQPGYIEIDGNCIYEFGSEVQPDGTPSTENNSGGFWDTAGDFLKTNAGDIFVVLGGILNSKKKTDPGNPTTPPAPPSAPEKKDRTLLYVGIGIVVIVGGFLLFKQAKKGA